MIQQKISCGLSAAQAHGKSDGPVTGRDRQFVQVPVTREDRKKFFVNLNALLIWFRIDCDFVHEKFEPSTLSSTLSHELYL